MDSFEKWWEDAHKTGKLVHGLSLKEIFAVTWGDAYLQGLRRAAEIATDENCDQTEYRCLTIERIGEAIEREASKLEREGV